MNVQGYTVRRASDSLRGIWGPTQLLMSMLMFATGASVIAFAQVSADPLVSSEYGTVVNAIWAEVWAAPLAIGPALHIIGAVINGHPRLRPWVTPMLRALGCAITFGGLWAFVIAVFAGGGSAQASVLHSMIWSIPYAWFWWLAITDFAKGIRHDI